MNCLLLQNAEQQGPEHATKLAWVVKPALRGRYGLAAELPAAVAEALAASVKPPKQKKQLKLGTWAVYLYLCARRRSCIFRCCVVAACGAAAPASPQAWQPSTHLTARPGQGPLCFPADAPKGLGTKLPGKKEGKKAAEGAGGCDWAAQVRSARMLGVKHTHVPTSTCHCCLSGWYCVLLPATHTCDLLALLPRAASLYRRRRCSWRGLRCQGA